jgi:calcineurin-like phosphoesterase family protein
MSAMRLGVSIAFALLALLVPAASAAPPWPPRDGPGLLFVHYGEEHWNDKDGLTLLPKVVADSARYDPDMVTMSGDKDNDGTVEQLTKWREIMGAYDRAGVPYFAAVGNHDRLNAPNQPGFPPGGSLTPYKEVFAGRPWPMGDAQPYGDPRFTQRTRPADDPPGAATHYSVDFGNTRWIFVDNSCWDITFCDTNGQNPADGDTRGQLAWMASRAGEASAAGKVVFVVMHMPTRDPGDQSYRDPTALNHTMGKGTTQSDIAEFERIAEENGVDGVFVGHIKGQFLYVSRNVPYYIDGGAGGELYTTGPVGADHGYWHGYRLVRVDGRNIVTDSVPIFVDGGITVTGPATVARGQAAQFEATGMQPVFNDTAKVPALELRDPDPVPGGGAAGSVPPIVIWGAPLFVFVLMGAVLSQPAPRRRLAVASVPALAGVVALTGIAFAQRSAPSNTPKADLPNPARIWTTTNPVVLKPAPSGTEDPRRNPLTQTQDGKFAARCPGKATVRIDSGWETRAKRVVVPSAAGAIVRSLKAGATSVRSGKGGTVARLALAQPADVEARVVRRGKVVATLFRKCLPAKTRAVKWNGRAGKGLVGLGSYIVNVIVRSDRKAVVRKFTVSVR